MRLIASCSGCGRSLREEVKRGHYSLLDILARHHWRAVVGGYQCEYCSGHTVPPQPKPRGRKRAGV